MLLSRCWVMVTACVCAGLSVCVPLWLCTVCLSLSLCVFVWLSIFLFVLSVLVWLCGYSSVCFQLIVCLVWLCLCLSVCLCLYPLSDCLSCLIVCLCSALSLAVSLCVPDYMHQFVSGLLSASVAGCWDWGGEGGAWVIANIWMVIGCQMVSYSFLGRWGLAGFLWGAVCSPTAFKCDHDDIDVMGLIPHTYLF